MVNLLTTMKKVGKISKCKFIGLVSLISAVVITVSIVVMNETLD
ncbi:MAG TPA: hypothetical protein VJ599_09040 [Nitrososphaeraceae archaeon]|nr:hypothetical protein [Nitrososphaeraceae archaeon]